MTIYYCREDEKFFTEEQLRADFETFRACGDTYSGTFADYMRNALDKNGALEIVRTDFSAARALASEFMTVCSASIYDALGADFIAENIYAARQESETFLNFLFFIAENTADDCLFDTACRMRVYIDARRMEKRAERMA